jgi:hypothetical protein
MEPPALLLWTLTEAGQGELQGGGVEILRRPGRRYARIEHSREGHRALEGSLHERDSGRHELESFGNDHGLPENSQ